MLVLMFGLLTRMTTDVEVSYLHPLVLEKWCELDQKMSSAILV